MHPTIYITTRWSIYNHKYIGKIRQEDKQNIKYTRKKYK